MKMNHRLNKLGIEWTQVGVSKEGAVFKMIKEIVPQAAETPGEGGIGALRKFLDDLGEGEIPVRDALIGLLEGCWHELENSGETKMHAGKWSRMESVRWKPPVLSFEIERHGAAVLGSIYAELQRWEVDLDWATAECKGQVGRRQVSRRQPTMDVEPVAEEIAKKVLTGVEDDPLLRWSKDGSVRVLVGEVIPDGSAPKETVTARRKRLDKAVSAQLGAARWQRVRAWTFQPTEELA